MATYRRYVPSENRQSKRSVNYKCDSLHRRQSHKNKLAVTYLQNKLFWRAKKKRKEEKEEKHTHRAHIYRERYICNYHNKLKRNENKSSDSAFLYYKIEGRRDRTGREQSEKKIIIYTDHSIYQMQINWSFRVIQLILWYLRINYKKTSGFLKKRLWLAIEPNALCVADPATNEWPIFIRV